LRGRLVEPLNVAKCVFGSRRWRLCHNLLDVMKAVFSSEWFLLTRLRVCPCGRRFPQLYNLVSHLARCPTFVSFVEVLRDALLYIDSVRDRLVVCPFCGRRINDGKSSKRLFAQHIIYDHFIALRKMFAVPWLSTSWMNVREPVIAIHRDVHRLLKREVREYEYIAASYGARIVFFSEKKPLRQGMNIVEMWIPLRAHGFDPERGRRYIAIEVPRSSDHSQSLGA